MSRLLRKFAATKLMRRFLLSANTTFCVTQFSLGDFMQQYIHGDIEISGQDPDAHPQAGVIILSVCGLLEGKSFNNAFGEYTSKMFHILKVDLSIWPPCQFISFRFLPPQLRVFYINVVYLLYSCIISFIKHNKKEDIEKVL
ncbi:hypothetical protein Y032_0004g2031 [Ancylostoma ceylanicum]|uniref:Uncharacterized protein n=1 Tax=Ancylostoma ceylanicum TaxID=53326 RepID=A0A016VW09_9BILA|nr:hypothetical protein Y032_0004g2031 [Ancylostoma ceylanicum]